MHCYYYRPPWLQTSGFFFTRAHSAQAPDPLCTWCQTEDENTCKTTKHLSNESFSLSLCQSNAHNWHFDFCFLQMFKSVVQLLTTVTLTPTAPTPKDHSPALVIRGTLEMGSPAMVLTYSFNLKFLVTSGDLYRKWRKDILLDFFWNKELNYSNIIKL